MEARKTIKATEPSLIDRYQQVIAVLLKYGFADVMAHPPFNRFIPKSGRFIPKRKGQLMTDFTRYERIRMVCEDLGATYIKFAQIASNRPDLLPVELIEELTGLQDHAIEVPFPLIRQVILRQLGDEPENLFAEFDIKPVASASMAQVHRAVLKDGREVALKILRPGIKEVVELDIRILYQMADLVLTYFPDYASFQPKELVRMFENSIRKELHFRLEAGNLRRFANNFKGNSDIHAPELVAEFCSDEIICMEFIRGARITNLERLKEIGMTGKALALKGINLYFEQVFDHGFFHADPHPGNIFVMEDTRICFVDYGMMGTVLEADKMRLANLLLGIANRDVQELKRALMRFGNVEKMEPRLDKELEYDIAEFLSNYSGVELVDIDGTEVIDGVNRLFYTYKIRVPPNLLLLLKALVIIEGVGLQLDPRYNIIANITPFVQRLVAKKYSPARLGGYILKATGDLLRVASNLPEDVGEVMRKIRQGRLHIEFEHTGLEPFYRELDRVSNRIAFALIISALILGSALLVIAHVPPYIYNISSLGFIGFVVSGLLALRLAWAILKHGKI